MSRGGEVIDLKGHEEKLPLVTADPVFERYPNRCHQVIT
jgi:hypothetical protein